jgi:glycerol uptake facilitator protein
MMLRKPGEVEALMAEALGTFFLAFIGGGAGILAPAAQGAIIPALAHGFALFLAISVLGRVSGAHVNPAVTLSLASVGRFPWAQVPWYIIAQFVGAIVAAFGVQALYGKNASIAPTIAAGVGGGTAFGAEAIGATFLVIAVVAAAADPRLNLPNGWAAWVIGIALAAAIFVVGPITGSTVNPALGLGPYIVNWINGTISNFGWLQFFVYGIAPIVGGIIIAWLYRFIAGTHRDAAR